MKRDVVYIIALLILFGLVMHYALKKPKERIIVDEDRIKHLEDENIILRDSLKKNNSQIDTIIVKEKEIKYVYIKKESDIVSGDMHYNDSIVRSRINLLHIRRATED